MYAANVVMVALGVSGANPVRKVDSRQLYRPNWPFSSAAQVGWSMCQHSCVGVRTAVVHSILGTLGFAYFNAERSCQLLAYEFLLRDVQSGP